MVGPSRSRSGSRSRSSRNEMKRMIREEVEHMRRNNEFATRQDCNEYIREYLLGNIQTGSKNWLCKDRESLDIVKIAHFVKNAEGRIDDIVSFLRAFAAKEIINIKIRSKNSKVSSNGK